MKPKMKLQKTVTTSVIKRGKETLIRKVIQYPPDTDLKPKTGIKKTISWHHKSDLGPLNLYNKNDAEQLEQAYQKIIKGTE